MGTSPENSFGAPFMSPVLGGPQSMMGQPPMNYMRYVSQSYRLTNDGTDYQQGMPPPQMSGPMFSPNHNYTQLPGGPPMHMNGPPNGSKSFRSVHKHD